MERERSPSPPTEEALLKAAGGDAELAAELAVIFLEDLPRMLSEVHAAVSAGDPVALRSRAHALKGASVTLGFTDVAQEAYAFEVAGEDGSANAESPAGDLEKLTRACAAAHRALHAYLSER